MTNEEIKDLFDRTNLTLAELSRMSGLTVKEVKKIVLGADAAAHLESEKQKAQSAFDRYMSGNHNPKPAPFGGHRE